MQIFDILLSQFHINNNVQILNKIKNNMIKLRSRSKESRLHLVVCNRNQRIAYRTSFYASFHVISCCISHHFMSYFIHFIAHITHIAHTSRMSRNSHFANSAHFMHCTIRRVILCVISYHFVMKIHIILIHTI